MAAKAQHIDLLRTGFFVCGCRGACGWRAQNHSHISEWNNVRLCNSAQQMIRIPCESLLIQLKFDSSASMVGAVMAGITTCSFHVMPIYTHAILL